MIRDCMVMTRRLALGSSVAAGATALAVPGASARIGTNVAPASKALVDRLTGVLRGGDLERLAEHMHPAVRTVAWTGAVELDVVGPGAYRTNYLAPYLSQNSDFKMSITKVLTNGIEVVTFYDVSATVDHKPSMWSGCNDYFTDGERIIEQWIEQDLWWRNQHSPTVNSKIMAEQLERSFRPQTTAANLAGMGRFISYKNTMMPSSERIAGFVSLLASEGDRIGYVLFQRDVMYDQSQTAI